MKIWPAKNRNRIAKYSLFGVIACILFLTCVASKAEEQDSVSEIKEQIVQLRGEAKYSEAVKLAEALLEIKSKEPDVKLYEIEDTERLIETLIFAARLPEEKQRELAETDRMQGEIDESIVSADYISGLEMAEKQFEIRYRILGEDHQDVAQSQRNLAIILRKMGNYEKAEPHSRSALGSCRRVFGDEHPEVVNGHMNLANILKDKGNYDKAEVHYSEALGKARDLYGDEHSMVAKCLTNYSLLLRKKGNYSQAELLNREALVAYGMLDGVNELEISRCLNNLAIILILKGEYDEAKQICRKALEIRRRILGEEHPDYISSLTTLGNLTFRTGYYSEAEPLFREVLSKYRNIYSEEHRNIALALNNLGLLMDAKGDNVAAESLLRDALKTFQIVHNDEHPDIPFAFTNLATNLKNQESYDEAEFYFLSAQEMALRILGDDHPLVARIHNNYANLLSDQDRFDEAEPHRRSALAIYRNIYGVEHMKIAMGLNNLANLLSDRGDYSTAEALHREALAMRRRALGDEHLEVERSLVNLASLLKKMGDLSEAEQLISGAAEIYEVARLRAGPGLARSTFERSPYPSLAAVCLELGKKEAAWPAAEKALARALADILFATEQRKLTPIETAYEDSLQKNLASLEQQLSEYQKAALIDSTAESSIRLAETRIELGSAEAEWSVWQREIAEKYPITEGQIYPLLRVQEQLDEETAIIGWLDVKKENKKTSSWGYVIRNEGPVVWAPLSSRPEEALANLDSWDNEFFHTLWLTRVQPLEVSLAGVKNVVVLPSGPVATIPVESLIDDTGTWISEKYTISYAPSATIFTWLQEEAATRGHARLQNLLLVGDPPFNHAHLEEMQKEGQEEPLVVASFPLDRSILKSAIAGNDSVLASLPRLTGTRSEVREIESLTHRGAVLTGPDATEQHLVELAESGDLETYQIIHLATHAFADQEQPERSCLVLSQVDLPDPLEAAIAGERIFDGLLTVKEILREWDLDAELVTLSACETALGKAIRGEGIVGFAHAFLQVGARSLIVSLWKVDDRATSLLMRRFYQNLLGAYTDERVGFTGVPMSKVLALQEAKRWLREYTDELGAKPYEHPRHWAAFILIGQRK